MSSLLLSFACAAPAARSPQVHVPLSSYLRGATAAQTSCPLAEVELSDHSWTLGSEIWSATCRGTRFRCTHVATGYGTGLTCVKQPAASPPPAPETATAAAPAQPAPAPAPAPVMEPPGAAELRALLDQERDAILACGGWRVVGLKAQVAPGAGQIPGQVPGQNLEVQLTGDLAGSPQEACVRHLLARIHPSPSQIPPGTAVVHVVR